MRLWWCLFAQSLGTIVLCLDYCFWQNGWPLHYHRFSALVISVSSFGEMLLTRQISRLVTRIKECIRVESIVVKKPKKCVMKVNRMEGVVKWALAHSAGLNFFEGSERN